MGIRSGLNRAAPTTFLQHMHIFTPEAPFAHDSSLNAFSSAKKHAKVARIHRYAVASGAMAIGASSWAAVGTPIGIRMPVVEKLKAIAASENIASRSKAVMRDSPPAIFSTDSTSTKQSGNHPTCDARNQSGNSRKVQ